MRWDGLEERGRGSEIRNAGHLQKLGKARKAILPWNLWKGIKPCRHLHFRLVRFHVGFWFTEWQDNMFVLFKLNQSHLSQWQHKMNAQSFETCFFHKNKKIWLFAFIFCTQKIISSYFSDTPPSPSKWICWKWVFALNIRIWRQLLHPLVLYGTEFLLLSCIAHPRLLHI